MYQSQEFSSHLKNVILYSLNISRVKIFAGKPNFLQNKYFVGNFSRLKRYKAPLIRKFKHLLNCNFTASLAALILEDGTSFDKGPFGLGNTESEFNLKYFNKAILPLFNSNKR